MRCKDCDADYIGETSKRLDTRLCEHYNSVAIATDGKSALLDHTKAMSHVMDWDSVHTLDHEQSYFPRKIGEVIKI